MNKNKITVTIFTPTYNRSRMISNLYDSLSKQTCFDFEWLIVDDGQDETESLINGFIYEEKKFAIRYYRGGAERGLARALNIAIEKAAGELFFKVDDDDELTADAIQKVVGYYRDLPERETFAGLSCMRAYKDGTVIGMNANLTSGEYVDCTSLQRKKYKLCGDKAEVYFTKILRMHYPIPTVSREQYTWEALLWNKIAHNGYKIRWYGDVIYYTEYLDGGETAKESEARYKNFYTYTMLIEQIVEYEEFTQIDKFKHLCRYFEIARAKQKQYIEFRDYFNAHCWLKIICWYASVLTKMI